MGGGKLWGGAAGRIGRGSAGGTFFGGVGRAADSEVDVRSDEPGCRVSTFKCERLEQSGAGGVGHVPRLHQHSREAAQIRRSSLAP